MQQRATTAGDAFWTLDPFALVRPGDPWYAEIEACFPRARYGLRSAVIRRLTPTPTSPEFVHIGVVGHGGTGKTTQVWRAIAELAPHRIVGVPVDAQASLDQGNFSFSDVMLVIARSVIAALESNGIDLPHREVELLRLWFAEELLTETHRRELVGSLQTEAGLGVRLLATLSAKVTAVLRSDNEYRHEIRRRAERDPAELVRRTNQLLDGAAAAWSRTRNGPVRLAIIVDNLEKLADRRQVDTAVLRRADEFRQLRCHLVLFFNPHDQYAPVTVQAGQAFDVVTMPVLPLRRRTESPDHVDEAALTAARTLLDKRVDLGHVFVDSERCLQSITKLSGGRLRDLLQLPRMACELADPDRVTPEHVESVAKRLAGERVTLAKPEHWPRLAEIHRDKHVANREDDAHLLLHSLVLNYDGEPWWDVHPLVRLDERFDAAWRNLSGIVTP